MKKCFKCNQEKAVSDFYRHPNTSDGYLGKCKECTKTDVKTNYGSRTEQYRLYDKERQRRSLRRIYTHRYNQIRARVGGFASRQYRVEGMKMLSREEFFQWCSDNQPVFDELYVKWEQSDFKKVNAPSIDRINNNLGYVPDNMQWLSFGDNAKKGDR